MVVTDQAVRVVVVVVADERSNQSVLLVVMEVEAMAGQASRAVIVVVAADQISLCCKWQAGHGGSRWVTAGHGGSKHMVVPMAGGFQSLIAYTPSTGRYGTYINTTSISPKTRKGVFPLRSLTVCAPHVLCSAGWRNAGRTVQCCMDTCCPSD